MGDKETTEVAFDRERYRQIAEEVALRMAQGGGSTRQIATTLESLNFTVERATEIVLSLVDRGLLKLNTMYRPTLTAAGEAYLLEPTADSTLVEEMATVKLEAEMRLRAIGATLLQSVNQKTN